MITVAERDLAALIVSRLTGADMDSKLAVELASCLQRFIDTLPADKDLTNWDHHLLVNMGLWFGAGRVLDRVLVEKPSEEQKALQAAFDARVREYDEPSKRRGRRDG